MTSRPGFQFPRICDGCRGKRCEPHICRAPCGQDRSRCDLKVTGEPPHLVVLRLTHLLNWIRPAVRIGWTMGMVHLMVSSSHAGGIQSCA